MKINNTLTNTMKSNSAMIITALLILALATIVSTLYWGDVSSPVKIGMYAFGYGTGVAAGVSISRRQK